MDDRYSRQVLFPGIGPSGQEALAAARVASYGVVMPIVPHDTACLRCVFVAPPAPGSADTCDTVGVIGPAVGVVASLAGAEALKLLVGARERLSRGLTWVDVWNNTM